MSDSKVREAFDVWFDNDRHVLSESDCWAAWQASRAAALKEAEEACRKVARDAAENGLSKPFNFMDGAYHAAEAIRAIAGRGA